MKLTQKPSITSSLPPFTTDRIPPETCGCFFRSIPGGTAAAPAASPSTPTSLCRNSARRPCPAPSFYMKHSQRGRVCDHSPSLSQSLRAEFYESTKIPRTCCSLPLRGKREVREGKGGRAGIRSRTPPFISWPSISLSVPLRTSRIQTTRQLRILVHVVIRLGHPQCRQRLVQQNPNALPRCRHCHAPRNFQM